MPAIEALYQQLCDHARETGVLSSIESLLGWDERCLLPAAAAEYRADQMTVLSGIIHARQTEPRLGDWLAELAASPLAADPASLSGATIRQLKRQYDKKIKLPQTLVEELTRTSVMGQQAWQTARAGNNFAELAPLLEKTIALKRQQADATGYAQCRYDALLDDYEPGELTSHVAGVLADLRNEQDRLLLSVKENG